MATILITGGTGLVGQLLQKKLIQKGHVVNVLTRNPKKENEFYWNVAKKEIDLAAILDIDYIIHIAGAGIADKRWTADRKQQIIDSRTKTTAFLLATIKQHQVSLRGFIAASAIGYYGAITSEKIFSETDKAANDFLGDVCKQWEASSLQFEKENIPTTIFRIGIVLSNQGGALTKMNTPIAITPIANGNHYLPWIHIEDLTNLFINAIEDTTFTGIYNAVVPEEITNYQFSKQLAKKTKKIFIPVGIPKWLLQLLFGEMAIILTTGSRISSKKVLSKEFQFLYKNLDKAFDALFKKP